MERVTDEWLSEQIDTLKNDLEAYSEITMVDSELAEITILTEYQISALTELQERRKAEKDICKTTGLPCIACNPGACEHRKEQHAKNEC